LNCFDFVHWGRVATLVGWDLGYPEWCPMA
jgi:hypothetical protein